MPDLPATLSLTTIPNGANIVSADHRNNYAAIAVAVNALKDALSGGTSGQLLTATDSDTIGWAAPAGVVKLDEVTLGAPATSITSAVLAGTYRNLLFTLDCAAGSDASLQNLLLRLNADSGANYRWNTHYSTAGVSAAQSDGGAVTEIRAGFLGRTAGTVTVCSGRIYNYATTGKARGVTGEFFVLDGADIRAGIFGGSWLNTAAAVTTIRILAAAGNLPTGTKLTTYGESA